MVRPVVIVEAQEAIEGALDLRELGEVAAAELHAPVLVDPTPERDESSRIREEASSARLGAEERAARLQSVAVGGASGCPNR